VDNGNKSGKINIFFLLHFTNGNLKEYGNDAKYDIEKVRIASMLTVDSL